VLIRVHVHGDGTLRQVTKLLVMVGMVTPLAARLPAQVVLAPTVEAQVAAALLPLPEEFRADATVLGYLVGNKLTVLREGSGAMICLADDPREARFHVACYHRDLDPFMARGRELRAGGMSADSASTQRNAEVAAGTLPMPKQGALWQLTAAPDSMDWATNTPRGARALYVVYIPGATSASTGLPATPAPGTPWLMFPGTPRAHIMFVPTM
jgi:hypothetical protein